MKKMTCQQLGGACEVVFEAATFEDIAALSKAHAMEMFAQKDAPHLEAMQNMQILMQDEDAMTAWFERKRQEFDAL